MGAGDKREIVAFDQRATGPTEGGGTVGAWVERFRTSARVKYLRGGEPIIGQRLRGVSPVVVTVHDFSQTRLVTAGWRVRDVRSGETFNIRSVTPGERPFEFDLLCETGVPNG